MSKLLAGAAMRNITPSLDMLPGLVSGRDNFQGVHSDIYARVIVVSDGTKKAALLGADMGVFPKTSRAF